MSDRDEDNRSNDENDEEEENSDDNDHNSRIKLRQSSGNSKGKRKEYEGKQEKNEKIIKKKKPDYRRELFNSLDAETKKLLIPLTNEDEIFAQLSGKDDLQSKLDLIHRIAKSQQKGIQRLEREENRRTIKQAGKAKTQELYKTLKRGLDGDLKYERKIENIVESYRAYELLKSFAVEQLSRADDHEGEAEDNEEWNEEEAENKELYENLYNLTKKEHRKLNDGEKKKLNKFLQKYAKQIMEKSNLGRWT